MQSGATGNHIVGTFEMGSVPGGQAAGIQRVRNTRGTLRGFRLAAPRGPQEERDARQAAAITGRYSTAGRTQHLRRLQGRQQGRIRRRAPPTTHNPTAPKKPPDRADQNCRNPRIPTNP